MEHADGDPPPLPQGAGQKVRIGAGIRDLTAGPIGPTLWAYALPILGANVLQSLNATVNAIWVSRLLGETGLTATSNANFIMFFLMSVVFGTTMAASLLVSQSVGAGDRVMIKRVVGASLAFFAALATLVAIFGYFFTPHILDAMQTPADAKAEAIIYLQLIFLSMPLLSLFVFLQMTQRGAGDARTPLYFSILAVVLDIIFNPLLIAGVGPFPKLGIAGSALSTMIAQLIAFVSLFVYLHQTKSPLALRGEEWRLVRFDPQIMRSLITRGLPMGAQMLVISGAAIVMMSLVNRYGVQTSAAYGAATVLWTYVQMPAMAIGASVSSMAAQNVGAQRWDRVNLIAREGVILGLVWTGVPVALLYLVNTQVLQLFLPHGTPALEIAERINHFALWSFMILSVTFVFTSVVRSTGAVLAPLALLFVSMWLVRVPLAAFASNTYGPDAVWASFPTSSAVSAVLAYLYYRYGDWRSARMMPSKA